MEPDGRFSPPRPVWGVHGREVGVRTSGARLLLSVEELDKLSRHSLNWEEFFGSSLDLAPSLLNIYDDIISCTARDGNDDGDDSNDLDNHSEQPAKSQSLPSRSDGRAARLPSLSQPSDRPVSMMEAGSERLGSAHRSVEGVANQKKRPLSISSMSSASTSSLPRMRKKRTNDLPTDSGIPYLDETDSFADGLDGHRDRRADQKTDDSNSRGFESRQSLDSGCVEVGGDRAFHYDNMSITSSEASSGRDEREVSSTSLTTPPGSRGRLYHGPPHSSPHISSLLSSPSSAHRAREDPNRSAVSRGYANSAATGSPFSPTSLRRLGLSQPTPYRRVDDSTTVTPERSALSGLSTPPLSPTSPPYSPVGMTSSPDTDRRPLSSSRSREARKLFFSNYEEHMRQATPPVSQSSTPLADSSTPLDDDPASLAKGESPTLTSDSVSSENSSNWSIQKLPSPHSSQAAPSPEVAISSQLPTTKPSPSPLNAQCAESEGPNPSPSSSQPSPTDKQQGRERRRAGGTTKHDPATSGNSHQRGLYSRSSRKQHPPSGEGKTGLVYVSYVQRVVTEIIESERTYIASLGDIIHGYMEPLSKILRSPGEQEDLMCLFGNIRDIYKFGCTFLADLEKTESDPVKVAQCFVEHNKGFVIYTDYCTNYPRAVEVLTWFMQGPEHSEVFKERQLALGHGLPLGAYLLRPVQRILKYHLLLQNIVKNCEKEGEEAEVLERAFQHMTQMAHHINEMKRKHEHAVRIQEIQSQLEDYVGEDLTRLGELVLESTFRVYGAKASRQVFLFEKGLLVSKKTEGGMLSCKTFILCSNLMLVEVIPNEPLSFHVIPFNNPRAQYTLQARNMEQKLRWCQEVKRLILESFKGLIPDNVKSLVMQLGREHDDDFVNKEALDAARKTQHTAPQYLEKRRFRKKSASRLPDFSLLKPQRAKRDGQRKGDNKGKVSPEIGRRAESKSPDSHRKIFSKQLIPSKHRSQSTSLPSTPMGDKVVHHVFRKAHSGGKTSSKSQPVTSGQSSLAAIIQPGNALASFTKSLTDCKLDTETPRVTTSLEEEETPEKLMRAHSFRRAVKRHPITSEDLSELVARCGGGPLSLEGSAFKDSTDFSQHQGDERDVSTGSLREKSDLGESSEEEEVDDVDGFTLTRTSPEKADEGSDKKIMLENDEDDTKPGEDTIDDTSPIEATKTKDDAMTDESRSLSLPALHSGNETTKGTGKENQHRLQESQKPRNSQRSKCSQSSENISAQNSGAGAGRMSRRDLQTRCAQRKSQVVGGSANCLSSDKEREHTTPALHDSYSKRTAERAVLKKKGLRLPNTSQHLSVEGAGSRPHPNSIKARLTDWHSVDKLTEGSMNDLSHLEEDPWEVNPETRPRARGHSDLTEMARVSGSKESLDWLVYLKRNPVLSALLPSRPTQRLSTSALETGRVSKDILEAKRRISAQVPYATPPRTLMTPDNMRRLGSVTAPDLHNSCPTSSSGRTNTSTLTSPPQMVKLTRPSPLTSRGVTSLIRCNSNPTPPLPGRLIQTRRPSSADLDRLTDESNRMVAEMEEYISSASSMESVKTTPLKFPTNLPTINVHEVETEEEEERDSNRMSIASSMSTSSYDSQGSSSSDGMVGTLKSKLSSWAQQAGCDTGDKVSSSSSTTSDEDIHSNWANLPARDSLDPTRNESDPTRNDLDPTRNDSDPTRNDSDPTRNDSDPTRNDLDPTRNDLDPTRNDFEPSRKDSDPTNDNCDTSDNKSDPSQNSIDPVKAGFDTQVNQKHEQPGSEPSVQEIRQLESVLREHGLGGRSLGARMAHSCPLDNMPSTLPHPPHTEEPTSPFCPESSQSAVTFLTYPTSGEEESTDGSPETHMIPKPHDSTPIRPEPLCSSPPNPPQSSPPTSAPIHLEPLTPDPRPHSTCDVTLSPPELFPDHARFSLPPNPAASQSLMTPPTATSCDIQQSDSGFSLQSTDSALYDSNTPSHCDPSSTKFDPSSPTSGPLLSHSNSVTPEIKHNHKNVAGISTLTRSGSIESVDSTDSFYERRLSVAFNSDVFRTQSLAAARGHREGEDLNQTEAEPRKHGIRQYVQLIEDKFRPQSPKVSGVRRREPGEMIRQRLENLKESSNYVRPHSRHGSEEREWTRSKSQPPSQHRKRLLTNKPPTKWCNDDIKVSNMKKTSSRESLAKSRESLKASLSCESPVLTKEDGVRFAPSDTDSALLALSLTAKQSHDNDSFQGSNSSHTDQHWSHLTDHHPNFRSADHSHVTEPIELLPSANQFVHRARSNSDQPVSEMEQMPSPDSLTGAQSMCTLDQLSSEVDNLVIMKGWVRALISKFQTTPNQ